MSRATGSTPEVVDHRHGERQSLAYAEGKLARNLVRLVREPEAHEELGDATRDPCARDPKESRVELQILADAELVVE
jgi:hypothetical protein